MSQAISIYMKDSTLRRLDALVEKCAAQDRESGLEGRRVTNRSKMIEHIVEEYLSRNALFGVEEIQYHVVELAKEYGASKVSLFGSYARGEADESSDVDILLEKGDIRGLRVLDFQDALSRRLGKNVDVVTTEGASEKFLRRILEDEVVIYEAG